MHSDSPRLSRFGRIGLASVAASACGLIVLAAMSSGCDSSSNHSSRRSSDANGRGGTITVAADPQFCREMLDRALDMMHPERLGISAERKTAAGSVNDWKLQCGGETGETPASAASVHERFVSPETLARIADPNFSGRDCDHVRTCFLFEKTLEHTFAAAGGELDRVVDLFYHVAHTVELVDELPGGRPLTPYEIVLFGKGTVADRTWVFAELVRQMQLDTVIVRPAGAPAADGTEAGAEANAGPLLAGVLLDGEVYLFDFRLGMPVPGAADDGQSLFVRVPATLAEATSNPALLERLSFEGGPSYPVQSAGLKSARIELVGNSSFWAPRMKRLQAALSGERSAVIYDPLADVGSATGLLTRVVEAGNGRWNADDVAVWNYPESRLQAFEALDKQTPQELEPWLRAPYPIISIDPTGQPQFGSPLNELLKVRTDHLLGEYAAATMHYTTLRGLERALVTGVDPNTRKRLVIPEHLRDVLQQRMINLPQREVHRRAAENAWFWLGLSQFQMGQFAGAIGTFGSYVNAHGSGAWTTAARQLRAICLAEEGQTAAAVQQLRELLARRPQHPGRHGIELLIRRWEG